MARKLQWMGAGWAGMGGSTNGIYPVHLLDGCSLVLGRGRAEKIVGCGVWKKNVSKVSPGMGW